MIIEREDNYTPITIRGALLTEACYVVANDCSSKCVLRLFYRTVYRDEFSFPTHCRCLSASAVDQNSLQYSMFCSAMAFYALVFMFCHIGSQTHLFGLRACTTGALHIGGVDIQVSTLASYLQWQSMSDQWRWSSNNLSPGSVSTLGHKAVDLNLKPPANDDRKSLKGRRFYARLSFSSRQLPGRERGEEGERRGEAAVNVGAY